MNDSQTSTLSEYQLAVRAERVDAGNWFDELIHAPEHVKNVFGLVASRHGDLAMVDAACHPAQCAQRLSRTCRAAAMLSTPLIWHKDLQVMNDAIALKDVPAVFQIQYVPFNSL